MNSYPTCPNTPCRGKELKLHRETDTHYALVCPSCHMLCARSKDNVVASERWVQKLKRQQEFEEQMRRQEARRLYSFA